MAGDTRESKKAKTHDEIINSAAALIRKEGIAGTSVDRVMQGAGKTVGGFYAHFSSKHQMVAEALRHAITQNVATLTMGCEDASPQEQYNIAVRRYLSRQHRDMGQQGCPLPSCLSEIEGADEIVGATFVESLASLVDRFAPMIEDQENLTARERALGTVATLIGALALARATKGSPMSDEILLAGRKLLFSVEGESK
jgi:TetR/AcrR family transcriptional regulator, transcriptional repressor for nem operon